MRKTLFALGEYYHIYNRGVEKRNIFSDKNDTERFFQSMSEFNSVDPIGSLYENSFRTEESVAIGTGKRLVEFVAYCLNPNHFHFILTPVVEKGIEIYMHRLGGYTWYFNNRYKRTGALFQGSYKAIYVDSNEYLLHLSAYVNLNWRCHQLGGLAAKLVRSSWDEYIGTGGLAFCNQKFLVLDQYSSHANYKRFAEDSLEQIIFRKQESADWKSMLID